MWKYFVGWLVVNLCFELYEQVTYNKRFLHYGDVLNAAFWGGLYLHSLFKAQ